MGKLFNHFILSCFIDNKMGEIILPDSWVVVSIELLSTKCLEQCLTLVVMCLLLLLLSIAVQIRIYAPIAKTIAHIILPKSAWKVVFFFLISFFPL